MNLAQFFSFPPTLPRQLKSNFIYLLWDMGWWGLYMGGTASFLTIYATRCGATSVQIGLLTALPALLSLGLSLPAGRLLKRFPAQRATVWSAFTGRILFLIYAVLPWVLPISRQFDAILVVAFLSVIPNTVIGISFSQFFMEAVPSHWRGAVVGTRNAIGSIISFIVTILCGQILSRLVFPRGYQVVFLIGFVGGIMTVYQLYHVHRVDNGHSIDALPPVEIPPPALQKQRFFPALDRHGRTYLRIIGLLFLFNLTNNMVAPLIPNLLVHTLQLSDATISVGTSMSTLLVLIVSLFIARMTRRTGNRAATAMGAGLLSFQAIALALAHSPVLYLVSAAISGVATGIINAAQYNYHLDNVPSVEPSSWLSVNLLLGNAAVLLGSLGGPEIARLIDVPAALFFFGGLRLAVGLAILKWG